MDAGEQNLFDRTIDVSSVDKLFFPDAGFTKGDLVGYYVRIAETMLAHIVDRPLAIKRYPDGIDGQGFFQKNAGSHYPDWLRRETIAKREGGQLDHVIADEPAALVYLADQGTIEFHPWQATIDDLEHPVEVVFDLDPSAGQGTAAVRSAARRIRDVLAELDVTARIKTSGSKGFHLHVPSDGTADWDTVRDFASGVAAVAAARYPDELTDEHRKDDRAGRVFVDWLRNGYGQTSVAPYSVRARRGAPVATPIAWDELGSVEPQSYDVGNLFRRLGQTDDPWSQSGVEDVDITTIVGRLEELQVPADS